jgi:RimJ/RimL family protein N-acetyltransferase
MARGGLGWAFENLNCSAVMGLCPAPNRHAWRLAEHCGFRVLGRLPQACLHARKNTWVDGVLVLCTPQDLAAV